MQWMLPPYTDSVKIHGTYETGKKNFKEITKMSDLKKIFLSELDSLRLTHENIG